MKGGVKVDLNKMTQKVQEALMEAQDIAVDYAHQSIDVEHLALALLNQEGGIAAKLLESLGIDTELLKAHIDRVLSKRPRVTGSGTEQESLFATQRLHRLLNSSKKEAKRFKDEYVSVEHIILALLDEKDAGPIGEMFTEQGKSKDDLLRKLKDIRGNQSCQRQSRVHLSSIGKIWSGPCRGFSEWKAGSSDWPGC